MIGGDEAMRLVVACRRAPRIVREARSPEDAIRIVREAVESDRTLVAMGENRVSPEEALELTARVLEAVRPAARRVLARRELARRSMSRSQEERDAAFVDDLEQELRERGEL